MTLPTNLLSDCVVTLIFGAIAIFLLVGAVKIWDWMTGKIDEEEQLNKNNTAVAVVMAAYMLSVAYIIGQVVSHVLGG
jgi:fucose permease